MIASSKPAGSLRANDAVPLLDRGNTELKANNEVKYRGNTRVRPTGHLYSDLRAASIHSGSPLERVTGRNNPMAGRYSFNPLLCANRTVTIISQTEGKLGHLPLEGERRRNPCVL